MEELTALQAAFPLIRIGWETDLGGATLTNEITKLDLQNRELESVEKVAQALSYYPALTFADMRGCSLSDAQMMELSDRFPEIMFLWNMEIAVLSFPTDAEEIDISGKYVEDISLVEGVLPYFPNLKKVVMCGCGIDNETMDAVNRRYEDIRFVWSVYMGSVLLRTDSTYFIPVKWGAQVTTEDLYNLRYCTDMVCVDIGHMEVDSCEWAAYMPNLKYLLMADTQVHDLTPLKDLKNLIYLELFLTRVTDLSPLVSCTALEDINLCYTYADPAPLLQMPWLQTIWWSGHWAARYNAENFRAMNPDIRLEFNSPSSTGNGWRELKNYYDMRDLVGMGYMTG
jgi:Leucine-rich repeat (LRR) protein